MMAPRCAGCTRRQHLKREASETRCAQTADASFSVSGTGDASPSTGKVKSRVNGNFTSYGNGNGNGNCRCAGRQRQRLLSVRGTAMATVAARGLNTMESVAAQNEMTWRHPAYGKSA